MRVSVPIKERLLARRSIENRGYTTFCWIWQGAKQGTGYGTIRAEITQKQIGVHVAAAEIWLPNYTSLLDVLHKCDIRTCFNPEHLFQGTQSDNIKDCVAKGRHTETRKTHCKYGHELIGDNIKIYKGRRKCLKCQKAYNAFYN